MAKRYLTITELAEYIGVAVKTLRNWKYAHPELLPPHVVIATGGKYDLWRWDTEDVDAWMHRDQQEQAVGLRFLNQ